MKKKQPFLLLEILVAIFIVCLCLIPLIQNPIQSYRAEIDLLEEMEKERLADLTFVEIKEMLLKNAIPWEKLPLPDHKTGPFSLPPAQLHIPGQPPKSLERSFTLHCWKPDEKVGPHGEVYRRLHIRLNFLHKKGHPPHSLIVRRLPREILKSPQEKPGTPLKDP